MTFDLDPRSASIIARAARQRRKYRDVVQLNAIQAILGDENGAISVPGEPHNYLVRIANGENSDGSTQYGRAFPVLSGIYMESEEVGTPVIIGIAYDGQWAILGIDRAATVEMGRNPRSGNVNSPYRQFFYMRYADQFYALPMGTQQTQTMEVRVEPSPYINDSGVHTTFVGGLIDLAGDVPAADGDGNSQHLIAAVFVNSSGALESKTSTAKLIDNVLTWTVDVVEAFGNRTARALAVRYYRLFTGHVLLTKADEFGDGRPWITGPTRRNNFTATTAPNPAVDDITLRYEVGSWWFDVTLDNHHVCLDNSNGAAVWHQMVLVNPATAAQNTIQPTTDVVPLTLKAHSGGLANGLEITDDSDNKHVVLSKPGATDPNTYINKQVGDSDTIIAGDTEANLFKVDAGNNEVRQGDSDTNYAASDSTGNSWWVGTGGLIGGHMYIPGADIVVDITDNNPTEVFDDGSTSAGDGWTAGELNGVTFPTGGDEHFLTVTKPGKYRVIWDMSFNMASPGANVEIHMGIMVDGAAIRDKGEAHRTIANNSDTGNTGANARLDLPNGTEQISLWILNAQNNNDVTVEHGNVDIELVAGT